MNPISIGLLKEGKQPPDQRVAFLPHQLVHLMHLHPSVSFCVQRSVVRCVPDADYEAFHIPLADDITSCQVLFGIKEVPIDMLLAGKTYFFFSHTIKKQAYNRKLLQAILEKNITLVDYECLTDAAGNRLVAFGRFAGLVGAYNALWTWGKRTDNFHLPRAYQCKNLAEMRSALQNLPLGPLKLVVTGGGRVSGGCMELLELAGIQKLSTTDFLAYQGERPVFTQLRSQDYYQLANGTWEAEKFYKDPSDYISNFGPFAQSADVLLHAAYWDNRAPALFTKEEMASEHFRIKVIADITCDIEGSIPSTHRASTIADPVYDYDPATKTPQPAFSSMGHIQVMAIDNLPTEVPYDASEAFGEMLALHVLPALAHGFEHPLLQRATIAKAGRLTDRFAYLEDFVAEKV
jgi:alanine dehydrogenase